METNNNNLFANFEKKTKKNTQPTIISKIVAVLSVLFVISFVFAMGIIPVPFGIGFSTPPVTLESGDVPCLAENETKPVAFKEIEVNVLNSTTQTGLAAKTSENLKSKGIVVKLVGNTENRFEGTVNIRTNRNNIVKAYTLANLFSGAKITYHENLKDMELILGESFSGLLEEKQITEIMKKTFSEPEKMCS